MRKIFIALLMTIPAQLEANFLTTAAKAFLSDAQLEFEEQNHTGQLSGISLSADYEISPNLFFRYEALTGGGTFATTTNEYNFNKNIIYAYKSFPVDYSPAPGWKTLYAVGAGISNKKSKFGSNSYEQSQLPVFLKLEITNATNIQISLSGYGQIDNLQNNRSGSLSFKFPTTRSLNFTGKYTNHKSKVGALQHCGSDYFLGFSVHF